MSLARVGLEMTPKTYWNINHTMGIWPHFRWTFHYLLIRWGPCTKDQKLVWVGKGSEVMGWFLGTSPTSRAIQLVLLEVLGLLRLPAPARVCSKLLNEVSRKLEVLSGNINLWEVGGVALGPRVGWLPTPNPFAKGSKLSISKVNAIHVVLSF